LADNLHRLGLDVFLDNWEITPGDVVVHELERGRWAPNGVLVVSPASETRPWVQQECAVMVDRAVDGRQRLIPVLLGDVEVPPFAAARLEVDFRAVVGLPTTGGSTSWQPRCGGSGPSGLPVVAGLVGPPGFRPEGPRRAILCIERNRPSLRWMARRRWPAPRPAERPVGGAAVAAAARRQLGPQTATVALRTEGQPAIALSATYAFAFALKPQRGGRFTCFAVP
jgi:TIR domain